MRESSPKECPVLKSPKYFLLEIYFETNSILKNKSEIMIYKIMRKLIFLLKNFE